MKNETLAQVFFCDFCEISKNNFFHGTTLVAVSSFFGDTEQMKPDPGIGISYFLMTQLI